jgi:hypothetical protein
VSHQFAVAFLQALPITHGQGLGRTADLQQAIFHRSSMVHYFERAALALGGNAFQAAAEHADAIPQKRAVSRIVNVTFDHRSSEIMRMISRL